jgi:hypothetical protein
MLNYINSITWGGKGGGLIEEGGDGVGWAVVNFTSA